MSNYGISVLIIILVTSLVAFYLLYKAKELNLGIVISVSIGSIILGFTFSPALKTVLKLLSENISINKKMALVISLLIVLFIFLLFILIVSFIISICIPKKLASIDCCVVIDRLASKIKIKNGIISIKDKFTGYFRKIVSKMKEIVKNVYNPINKLKKPVDTKQIIDTMGIEKNENGIIKEKNIDSVDIPDTFANLIGFMEPWREVADVKQDSSTDAAILDQTIEANSVYDNLVAGAYQEIVATQITDIKTDKVDKNVFNDLSEIIVEGKVTESELAEIDVVENKLSEIDVVESELPEIDIVENELSEIDVVESELAEIDIVENELSEIDIVESELKEIDIVENELAEIDVVENELSQIGTVEAERSQALLIDENDAKSFVLKAFESKDAGRKEVAIEYYIEALQHEPNNEMIFWIVLDVCALYKQLGLSELAKNILEGLVREYGAAIQPEVKMEIMNYLK